MKIRRHKCKASNAGYSLIELIVTVLISSVIIMAVVGFLIAGLNHFRVVNSETILQTESQVTEIFVTELFQEATGFTKMNSSDFPAQDSSGNAVNMKAAVEVKRGADVYILAHMGDELRFAKITVQKNGADTTAAERLQELVDKGRSKTFLAQHVKNVTIFYSSYTYMEENGISLIPITLEFKVDQKEYSSVSMITLRNMKRN